MNEITSKQNMLDLIHSEWEALKVVLDPVGPERMVRPGVESSWSVKDILAHISAWERLMIQWIKESLRGETPQRPSPGEPWDDLDLFNEQLFKDNKNKKLEDVLQEFPEVHQNAVKIVEAMKESDLFDPDRFAWRAKDPIWHLVAGNTWLHYKEHRDAISSWIESSE